MSVTAQPWIYSAKVDAGAILAPAWVVSAVVLLFPGIFGHGQEVSLWWWVLLVVGVDVSHVYSTLFRTYLDRRELRTRPALYFITPLLGLSAGIACYVVDPALFWRVLAYLAVFHFVRQQYGFLMLYARKERDLPPIVRRLDQAVIYAAAIYPLIYWHSHLPRKFDWFMSGEFVALPLWVNNLAAGIYVLLLMLYVAKEALLWQRGRSFNLPRNVLVAGTALSWWTGIIWADGDLAFTFTNVIAHGIPYMALIWIFKRNQVERRQKRNWFFSLQALPLYLGILMLLAYLEEGLWDGMVWREHQAVFQWAGGLPLIGDTGWAAVLVPLLALPQITHYLLDGLIWRLKDHPEWSRTLLLADRR